MTEESKKQSITALRYYGFDTKTDVRVAIEELDKPDEAAEHNADIACNMARKYIELKARADELINERNELGKYLEEANANTNKWSGECGRLQARADALADVLSRVEISQNGNGEWIRFDGKRYKSNISYQGSSGFVQKAHSEWSADRSAALTAHHSGQPPRNVVTLEKFAQKDSDVNLSSAGMKELFSDLGQPLRDAQLKINSTTVIGGPLAGDVPGQTTRKVVPLAMLHELFWISGDKTIWEWDDEVREIAARHGWEVE